MNAPAKMRDQGLFAIKENVLREIRSMTDDQFEAWLADFEADPIRKNHLNLGTGGAHPFRPRRRVA